MDLSISRISHSGGIGSGNKTEIATGIIRQVESGEKEVAWGAKKLLKLFGNTKDLQTFFKNHHKDFSRTLVKNILDNAKGISLTPPLEIHEHSITVDTKKGPVTIVYNEPAPVDPEVFSHPVVDPENFSILKEPYYTHPNWKEMSRNLRELGYTCQTYIDGGGGSSPRSPHTEIIVLNGDLKKCLILPENTSYLEVEHEYDHILQDEFVRLQKGEYQIEKVVQNGMVLGDFHNSTFINLAEVDAYMKEFTRHVERGLYVTVNPHRKSEECSLKVLYERMQDYLFGAVNPLSGSTERTGGLLSGMGSLSLEDTLAAIRNLPETHPELVGVFKDFEAVTERFAEAVGVYNGNVGERERIV